MYKIINEYMSKINMTANDEITNRISNCLREHKGVRNYTLSVNYNHYILDIRIHDYSVEHAVQVFYDFQNTVAYPYSSLHVRFNEGQCVRYRFLTCKENKDGFYCEIVFQSV